MKVVQKLLAVVFLYWLLSLNIILSFQPLIFHSLYQALSNHEHPQAVLIVQRVNDHKPVDFLTTAENQHMNDVSELLNRVKIVWGVLSIVLTLSLLFPFETKDFFRYCAVQYAIICMVFGLLFVVSWEWLFTHFHQLFFPQGNWSFPADSTLIQFFPDEFWQRIFLLIIFLPLLECLLLFLGSKLISRKSPR